MSFSQALSGLNAQAQKLGAIGNNIANSQTVGFKSSNVQFADVFANSRVGLGTKVSTVLQNFSEGNIESTNRNLDLAVAGTGFFRFQQSTGEVGYSRNGQLTMTAEGHLINAQGARIMGYGLEDNAEYPFSNILAGGQPEALNVPSDDMPARATGTSEGENNGVFGVYNLDAGVDVTDPEARSSVELRTDPGDPNAKQEVQYHYANSYTVYDSLGRDHAVTVYYTKTGDNTWQGQTAINGYYVAGNDFNIAFQPDGRQPKDQDGNDIGVGGNSFASLTFGENLLGGGSEPLEFDFDLRGTTQFAGSSTQSSLTQDGYAKGSLVGITIAEDGRVMRNFSNEQSRAAGQVVLVNFRNPEGLNPIGDNLWMATEVSGNELYDIPGTGLLGNVVSGAVETSNVDMAGELVNMIIAQRAYQANSQTIKTQDEILQTAINLR